MRFPGGQAIDPSTPSQSGRRARVIAVVNQKGGVGKTTTAVNLSASLGASEHPILLVDLDPQANASSAFGIHEPELQLYDALMENCVMLQTAQPTELSHLHVVPSGEDLVGAEIELVTAEQREGRLRQVLAPLLPLYDFVFIDCPPSLGLLTLNALAAADAILIPLQCEYYALEGLARLLRTVDRIRAAVNPNLVVEGIVLTMVDLRSNLTRQVADEARRHFEEQVFRVTIPRNVRLSEAPSHGKPVLLYDIQSKGATAYLQLAEELLGRRPGTGPPRKPPLLPIPHRSTGHAVSSGGIDR